MCGNCPHLWYVVWGLGYVVRCMWSGVWGLGPGAWGLGSGVCGLQSGVWYGVRGLGAGGSGSGVWVGSSRSCMAGVSSRRYHDAVSIRGVVCQGPLSNMLGFPDGHQRLVYMCCNTKSTCTTAVGPHSRHTHTFTHTHTTTDKPDGSSSHMNCGCHHDGWDQFVVAV